ncbi:MAG: M48 family metalloprotease [Candidatus Electrothrix sp. YB6]
MIYNNLIYFLAVIFVLSTSAVPDQPLPAPWFGLPLFFLLLYSFYRLAGQVFNRPPPLTSGAYFAKEKKLSILATILFISSFLALDLKYYLHPLSFGGTVPVLENSFGVLLFFAFLALIWLQALPSYRRIFRSSASPGGFVVTNIRINLTIILPWFLLSLLFDLLNLVPISGLDRLLESFLGETFLFLLFILVVTLIFPPAVRRLWGCVPMEPGPQRRAIEEFCRSRNFSAEILYWPLFEGKMITAGIMGFVPGFRYLLLTPALLTTMGKEELEAVLAHEIGHVKRYHLVLYIVLFFGFSLVIDALYGHLPLLLLNSNWFYWVLLRSHVAGDQLLSFIAAAAGFLFMLLYFRFLFGYFIRNFERQADLYAFRVQNSSFPLIRSFEKIAALSGNIRDKKNWHHFGIGERIACLEKCEKERRYVTLHDYKVYLSLAVYFLLVALSCGFLYQLDTDSLRSSSEARYFRAVLRKKLKEEPDNRELLRLFGDVLFKGGEEAEALQVYEKASKEEPVQVELANNLAWLLLTAEDRSLQDSVRALELAQSATRFSEKGYVLDTLATAQWANGAIREAVSTELQAIRIDPENRAYYQEQIDRFRRESWDQQELKE